MIEGGTFRAVPYDDDRTVMLDYVPATSRRLLDVGCATGRFGRVVRESLPEVQLWGIDLVAQADDGVYDRQIVGSYPDAMPSGVRFDCIVFNDVLEHMIDPWGVLRHTHRLLASRGVVVASIPNVRHHWVLRDLVLHGRWNYVDHGLLDRTHLRFFTRTTAVELFTSTGYTVEVVAPLLWPGEQGRVANLNRLLGGRLLEFVAQQYAITARPRQQSEGLECE